MEMSFPRDKNSPDPPHSQRQRRVNPENEKNSENLADLFQIEPMYESIATVGESRVWLRADFQSGSRVLKKVF